MSCVQCVRMLITLHSSHKARTVFTREFLTARYIHDIHHLCCQDLLLLSRRVIFVVVICYKLPYKVVDISNVTPDSC